MAMYEHQKCDGCGKLFAPEDDVVVCPVCGTPQHRACWQNAGGCVNDEKHGEGFEWKAAETANPEKEEDKKVTCPMCGEKLLPSLLFCTKCGHPMGENAHQENNPFDADDLFGEEHAPGGGVPPFGMPLFDIYGGVPKDEKIDDVPVKDVIEAVQVNSRFYLPRFKAMEGGKKKVGWNWGAFFFAHLWFFYRKNYVVGVIYTLLNILTEVIFMEPLQKYQELLYAQALDSSAAPATLAALAEIMPPLLLYSVIALAVRVLFAMFANHIYKLKVFKSIAAAKVSADDDEAYHMTLRRSGGANMLYAAIAYMGTTVLVKVMYMISQMFIQ